MKRFLSGALLALGTILFLFLSAYGFLYTHYSLDAGYDTVFSVERDSVLLHAAALAVFGLLCAGIVRLVLRRPEKAGKRLHILLGCVMVTSFAACVVWIACGNFLPRGDQHAVLEGLRSLREGNYEVLTPSGYFGAYKQQIPMGVLFSLLFRIAGSTSYEVIEYTGALCVPLLIFAGFRLLGELFGEEEVQANNCQENYCQKKYCQKNYSQKIYCQTIYCLLMLFCLPLFVYTAFVYGEVISATAAMVFAWLFAVYWRRKNYWTWIGMALCGIIGTMARGNFLIVLTAALILLIIHAFLKRSPASVLLGVGLLLLVKVNDAAILRYYEVKSGIAIDQGVPLEGWIAMGLDEYGPVAYGWYTGYVVDTYKECGYDTAAARKQCLAYIRDRIQMLKSGAGVGAAAFFKQKILVQWNEPAIECFTVNHAYDPAPAAFVERMVNPATNKGVREFMNQYQCILYLGVLLYCLTAFWNKKEFSQFLLLTAVIGGFLFTLIWETKTRYVFPYFIYMIPYAAAGWSAFAAGAGRLRDSLRARQTQREGML